MQQLLAYKITEIYFVQNVLVSRQYAA